MKAAAALAVMLASVCWSQQCRKEGIVLICRAIPPYFDAGCVTVVMSLSDVGTINSTAFRSDNLTSVSKLTVDDAGVSVIAEGAFSSLRSLAALSLKGNMLTQVEPAWFGAPAVLTELTLTENHLEAVTGSMLGALVNLKQLSLNKNRIRSLDPDSLSSHGLLAQLDLSENRLTRVPPQVFSSLKSTKIRLDGNPWDCSCGGDDFVSFLRDLQNRSLLERPLDVTCESPPSLKGQAVLNVSVCGTSVPPASPAGTTPASTGVQGSNSARPKPEDPPTTSLHHAGTDPSIHPKPPTSPGTASKPAESVSCSSRPPTDTQTVCVLAAVIGLLLLLLLLLLLCLLAVTRRRKRSNKTVTPSHPKEEKKKEEEEEEDEEACSRSGGGPSVDGDPEVAERMRRRGGSFSGVRAKSAHAVMLTSPFCESGKTGAASHTERERKDGQNPGGGGGVEEEVGRGGEASGGGSEEGVAHTADTVVRCEDPHDHTVCVGVHGDVVPYLSIGTHPSRAPPNKHPGHRGQGAKPVIGRVSTWPPTAVQWQARCKEKEKEELCNGATLWAPDVNKKFSNIVEHTAVDHHADTRPEEQLRMEARPTRTETPLHSDATPHGQNQGPAHGTTTGTASFTRVLLHSDSAAEEPLQNQDQIDQPSTVSKTTSKTQNPVREEPSQTSIENPKYHEGPGGHKSDLRKEPKPAGPRRQRAEPRGAGSKGAPSSGSSPDDETLLSGNQYAVMDLLHEVVQNNGRWTRERWKQIHANGQRR